MQLSDQMSSRYIDDVVQDCSISIANALGILLSCFKPSIYDTEVEPAC